MYPIATMEVGDSSLENLYYSNLDETRVPLPAGYPTDTTTNPNNYVAELQGAGSQPVIGPGIVLKVMSGDQFSVRVSSWYQLNGSAPGTPVNPLTDVLGALINGIGAIPGEHISTATLQANSAPLSTNVLQFLSDTGSSIVQTKPHAFLNWMLFDNQFNYVAASSGFQQVGASGVLTPMILTNLPITSSGYLYIYVSNETPNIPVFFDNLQVTQTRGPLLEEDHYYPFGLLMSGISDRALKQNYAENKYRYNGIEYDSSFAVDEYEAHYRDLDPQLARWWQIDPEADKEREALSPYASMSDDPIFKTDPLGNEDDGCCKELWDAVSSYVSGRVENFKNNTLNELGWAHEHVSDAVDQAGQNLNARWDAGATFPQQFLANPLSAVTGVEGEAATAAGTVSGTKVGGDILKGGENGLNAEVPQVTKNAAQGKAWEAQVTKDIGTEGHANIAEQVTVKPNGVSTGNVRLDNISTKDGKIALTDAKSSATAPLTKNQKPGYPAIEKNGGVVVGNKGASQGYPAGTVIPPTKVDIRRPNNNN
jgi:RHS repeat-associated protein